MVGDSSGTTYGTLSEKLLHEVWDGHEFCYPVLERLITNIKNIDTVLDLGCGSGEMLSRLSKLKRNLTFIGIDSSKVSLDSASQKLGTSASLIRRDVSDVFTVEGGQVLFYSSGFTSNLFPEAQWNRTVVDWLQGSPVAYAFVYDVFWWDPLPEEEMRQSGVFEGKNSSLDWHVRRGTEEQTSYIYDAKNDVTTTVTSFNHRRRSLFMEGKAHWHVYEVLHKKVKTGEGFLTESCTRVVARSDK